MLVGDMILILGGYAFFDGEDGKTTVLIEETVLHAYDHDSYSYSGSNVADDDRDEDVDGPHDGMYARE